MELELEQGQNPLYNTLQNIIFSDNLYQKMTMIIVVINPLKKNQKKKTNTEKTKKYIQTLYKDKKFMHMLKYYSHIQSNTELAVEYFGMDYLSSPDYHYNEED